uniref:CheY chemotaxis protein or a CheY-like REC (Receiver) domain n=1 Tax=Candidatus Kentrum sp. DK TaxID=2126562 RepID=A0A450SBM0_9GAMM|nr:MAG: CheY chemotaxis protein or a CheY-like REC (receiver) domain [Candidatus Kentron sp. DK]
MGTKQKRLLVIDDSNAFRESIQIAGKRHRWWVHPSDSLEDVRGWLVAGNKPDVVLLDWELGGQEPNQFAELLRERGLTERTLLLSADIDEAREQFAKEYGLAGIRLKPLDLRRFEDEVRLPPRDEDDVDVQELVQKLKLAADILNSALTKTLWRNDHAKNEPLTHEQRLIMKWLRVEMDRSGRGKARRIDWDGEKGLFLESRLYRFDTGEYALVRDWRDENEQIHDHEFLNLEEQNPTPRKWLRAVARLLLAQRYAISRFRVYKVSPLPNTEGLEKQHAPLVVPEFQSGGSDARAEHWLQVGFQPHCIDHIDEALKPGYSPAPRFVTDAEEDESRDCNIPRIQYGESGTYRVLFPVSHPDTEETVALLAMDRRLDHLEGLQGFDQEVVELATRMASDEIGLLDEGQWGLMQGLVRDIGRRIARWLEEDEKARAAKWHETISRILIETFADAQSSPEMIYDGISQVCAALADEWNREGKAGDRRISGHVLGTTPWPKQAEKGPAVSSWCIARIDDIRPSGVSNSSWQVVAGWGEAYGECRANGGRMTSPYDAVSRGEPWRAAVIQDFQRWSRTTEDIPCECLSEETRQRVGSWLAVPMQVEGKIQALMVIHSPHAHYFTRFHSQLMEQAAKRLLPLLAAALRETRARDAFTASVMHEVKNESQAARMLLAQVQSQAGDTEWVGDLLQARHYLDELNALGHDTLDIFRVGRGDRVRAPDSKAETTTTLARLIDNATLGWRSLYSDIEFGNQFPEELAARTIVVPHIQGFRRVLRVLLHNAFRHGREWVRIVARLGSGKDGNTRLELAVTNGAYQDTVSELDQTLDSANRPSASPLVGGRLGLVVARQLATEAGGVLGTLQYTGETDRLGQARITLVWPVKLIA